MIKQLHFKTLLLMAMVLLGAGTAWAQSDKSTDYTGNVTLSTAGGSNASECIVKIGDVEYNGIKAGTSKNAGAVKITVPSNTKYLHMHIAAWNNEGVTLTVTPEGYSEAISLTANSGISNNSPFTFNGDPSSVDYYKVITFASVLTAATDLTFTATEGKRFVVWGVTAELEGGNPPAPVTYTVSYDANGGTGTMTDSNSPYESGATVTVLDNTFTRNGYDFTKWNTAANGSGTDYAEGATFTIGANTTLYAQWEEQSSGQDPEGDVLNWGATGSPTNYTDWTYTAPSGAEYKGQSSGTYQSIQLRSNNNNSGIVTTVSVGNVKKVTVVWNSKTQSGRTLNVYGKNTSYASASDLYGDDAGELLGTIVCGTSTSLTINGNYAFIGLRSASSALYLDKVTIIWETGAAPSPSITVSDNNELAYNATSGSFSFVVNNSTNDGSISVSEEEEWISGATISGGNVTFTTTANNTATAREGVITLTYTYDTSAPAPKTVTKTVTVTQAGNPNVVDNISDITTFGTAYKVKGTVVATNARGLVIGDGTGYVYYYKTDAVDQAIGDKISISGTTGTYGNIIQFTNTATVAEATSSNYNGTPAAEVITAVPDYTEGYHLSTYLQFEGTLSKSSNNYLVTLGEAQIQVSYPTTAQGTALTALVGKNVLMKGYFSGINSSKKFTVMLESVEEVASTAPVINVDPATVNLAADATSGEFGYSITNPVAGTGLTAACQADWIDNITVGNDKVTFTTTANEGAAREATITLTYINVTKNVSVKQAAPAKPATLPFAFDGGKADVKPESGMTQEGLGSDYTSSPKLRFDGAGDYLILYFDERPGKLTFDIKGNSFSGGTFMVQTSEDGVTYTDLETYTELGATQTEEFNNLGENVRYIKWIYTEKVDGNVALGNINLAKYKELQKYTLTVSGLENVYLFVFDAAALNDPLIPGGGNGSVQVLEGTQVLISPAPAEGYELQSLMVDGVDHKADLEPGGSYTFTMPEKNITITATVSEVIPVETTTYTLATTITSGKHYIITNGVDKAMGGQNSNNRAAVDATIHEGKAFVTSDAKVCEVVIYGPYTVGNNQCYTIYDEANGYLYAASSSNNYLRTEELLDANGNGQWTIEIDNEGIATIKAQGENSHNWMRYNSGSKVFSCYASNSNQSEIYLFEKDGDNGTVTTTVQIAEACTDGEKYYGTYSNENAFVVPSDVTVAEIGIKDGALNVKEYVTGSLVPANTGVMISSATPGDKSLTLATGGASLMGEGNALRPSGPNGITNTQMDDPTGDYLYYRLTMHKGTQIGFWWGADGGAAFDLLDANKAYLKVPKAEGAREGFAFGDVTTGISHMLLNGEQTTHVYDLQGRSVAQPTKGLYIVNGKKVVVK